MLLAIFLCPIPQLASNPSLALAKSMKLASDKLEVMCGYTIEAMHILISFWGLLVHLGLDTLYDTLNKDPPTGHKGMLVGHKGMLVVHCITEQGNWGL